MESKILLFQSMLTAISIRAFGGVYAFFVKVNREDKKVASRSFLWYDDGPYGNLTSIHTVMARSLPEINNNGVPEKGPAEQPQAQRSC